MSVAAGMVLMSGWKGECDLIDPMCGSGTIPIEAALIARNIAPGVLEKNLPFENGWISIRICLTQYTTMIARSVSSTIRYMDMITIECS